MKHVVAVLALVFAGAAMAQAPTAQVAPRGEPEVQGTLRDADFGVRKRAAGLKRQVEMYQWQRAGAAYATVWSAQRIDSSRFDPAHGNPGSFPIRTRYWIATQLRLDGKPLGEDVLKEYGRWRAFRPGFSALPGNLAATFQPEGDGLSSSENPLDPQVGDLRITWHALELPPLAGKVALENGTWVPVAQAPAAAVPAPGQNGAGAVPARAPAAGGHRPPWAWLLGAGLAALALVLALLARGRTRAKTH